MAAGHDPPWAAGTTVGGNATADAGNASFKVLVEPHTGLLVGGAIELQTNCLASLGHADPVMVPLGCGQRPCARHPSTPEPGLGAANTENSKSAGYLEILDPGEAFRGWRSEGARAPSSAVSQSAGWLDSATASRGWG